MKTLCLMLALATSLSACNAMEGLGRDIKSLGYGLEKKAQRQQGGSSFNDSSRPQDMSPSAPQQTMQAYPVEPVSQGTSSYPRY